MTSILFRLQDEARKQAQEEVKKAEQEWLSQRTDYEDKLAELNKELVSTAPFICFNISESLKVQFFYAPGLKGPPRASSNQILCLSVRPFVGSSVLLTCKVQYLKF